MFTIKLNRDKIRSLYGPNAVFSITAAGKKVTISGITLTDNEYGRIESQEMAGLQSALDKGLIIFENEGVPVKDISQAEDSALRTVGSAMLGDISILVSPESIETTALNGTWKRTVEINFRDSKGRIHGWLSTTFPNAISVADTSVAGTSSITSTDLVVDRGKASVEISGDATDWLAGETDTLTVANVEIMGNTITGGASTQTFV